MVVPLRNMRAVTVLGILRSSETSNVGSSWNLVTFMVWNCCSKKRSTIVHFARSLFTAVISGVKITKFQLYKPWRPTIHDVVFYHRLFCSETVKVRHWETRWAIRPYTLVIHDREFVRSRAHWCPAMLTTAKLTFLLCAFQYAQSAISRASDSPLTLQHTCITLRNFTH